MAVCGYLLLSCTLWDALLAGKDPRVIGAVCLGFLLSRALSGFAVAVFPLAKAGAWGWRTTWKRR